MRSLEKGIFFLIEYVMHVNWNNYLLGFPGILPSYVTCKSDTEKATNKGSTQLISLMYKTYGYTYALKITKL